MCIFTDLQAHPSSQEAPRTSSEAQHNGQWGRTAPSAVLLCNYWLMQVNRDSLKMCFFFNVTYLNWWLWAHLQNSSISIHVDTKNKFLKVHFNLSSSSCDVRLQSKSFSEPCVRRTLLITFSGTLSVIGVNIKPGSTQLHLIPNLDNPENNDSVTYLLLYVVLPIWYVKGVPSDLLSSLAAVLVKPSTPALEAA